MFAPVFAASLVLQVATTTAAGPGAVPHWDTTASCKGAAAAAGEGEQGQARMKGCMESEARTRETLEKTWTGFAAKDRAQCIKTIQWFEPTYTELAACLEMGRDAKGQPITPLKREPTKR